MFRLAPKHVNAAGRQVVFVFLVREKRSETRAGYATARLVLIQSALERANEQVAFSAVVINHPQPVVWPAIVAHERVTHIGDYHVLAVENEQVTFIYLRIVLVFQRPSIARIEFALNFLEDGLEFSEIQAGIPLRNLFSKSKSI